MQFLLCILIPQTVKKQEKFGCSEASSVLGDKGESLMMI